MSDMRQVLYRQNQVDHEFLQGWEDDAVSRVGVHVHVSLQHHVDSRDGLTLWCVGHHLLLLTSGVADVQVGDGVGADVVEQGDDQ